MKTGKKFVLRLLSFKSDAMFDFKDRGEILISFPMFISSSKCQQKLRFNTELRYFSLLWSLVVDRPMSQLSVQY